MCELEHAHVCKGGWVSGSDCVPVSEHESVRVPVSKNVCVTRTCMHVCMELSDMYAGV